MKRFQIYFFIFLIQSFALLANDEDKLKNRGLNQEEIDCLYEIMGVTHEILVKHSINYRLEGGSLLGAVRHGGFIPWDDDGDFDVLQEDLAKIIALKDEFLKVGMEVIEVPGWGLQVFYKNSPELLLTDWNGLKSKKPFLDLISVKKIKVVDWKKAITQLQAQLKLEEETRNIRLNAKLKNLDQELHSINRLLNNNDFVYILSEETAFHDYPSYYLTEEEWAGRMEPMKFGNLVLKSFLNPTNYLDRNYPDWDKKAEILMDHDSNKYFDKPIVSKILSYDHKRHSNPAKLERIITMANTVELLTKNP